MKKYWLQQNRSKNLVLYFSGWGVDARVVQLLEKGEDDICVVYDYSDLNNLRVNEFKPYESIYLVAWSLGVWAAAYLLQNSSLPIAKSLAINGTPIPVDDLYGIPESVFLGTLEGLTVESLLKFDRRMCGDKAVYQQFVHLGRSTDITALKIELQNIFNHAKSSPSPNFEWSKAVIGTSDLIFPTSNQQKFWGGFGAALEMPHYPFYKLTKWNDLK